MNKLDDPEIEIVRQLIERAVVEHCTGADLWLTTFLAAERVMDVTTGRFKPVGEAKTYRDCDGDTVRSAWLTRSVSNGTPLYVKED